MIAASSDRPADQVRNKYNTLTPAEAKKLNRSLFVGAPTSGNHPKTTCRTTSEQNSSTAAYLYGTLRHAPIRTASVLHKPRAPPIVITDLDTTIDQLDCHYQAASANSGQQHNQSAGSQSGGSNSSSPQQQDLVRSASIRSAFGGSLADGRRHTVNYGRASAMNSRSSLHSAGSASNGLHQRKSVIHDQSISMNDSTSNLSFKSSLDVPDSAIGRNLNQHHHQDPGCRLQTMSVDLGGHYGTAARSRVTNSKKQQFDPMLRGQTIARIKYNNASNKLFSDESYSSTQSNVSCSTLRPTSATPSKFSSNSVITSSNINTPMDTRKQRQPPTRSASKASLSASTYRVLQSPFANFKKMIRNRLLGGSASDSEEPKTAESHFDTSALNYASHHEQHSLAGDLSISDSISQISLNKSYSPPVCPPPPGELKSMCYMESAINYSNYDEFTKSRNERMAQRQQAIKESLNTSTASNYYPATDGAGDQGADSDSWQLASLPVFYERNLTTVFEEKQQNSCEQSSNNQSGLTTSSGQNVTCANPTDGGAVQQDLIRPPRYFDDSGDTTLTNDDISMVAQHQQQFQMQKMDSGGSMQSINSCTSIDSGGLQQHQQPQQHQPYRFSFAQPLKPAHEPRVFVDQVSFTKNTGLPPRMPTDQRPSIDAASETTTDAKAAASVATKITIAHRHDNSSSGNSSNCSSQLNGINSSDRQNSLADTSSDKSSYTGSTNAEDEAISSPVQTVCNVNNGAGGYGGNLQDSDEVADLTLLSEASTLQGAGGDGVSCNPGFSYYATRCSELERTVSTLKDKLISKEKELTDLQLNQLNNDYTIERLKKRISQLERENAQLKKLS